jgi:hypothetical protein
MIFRIVTLDVRVDELENPVLNDLVDDRQLM